MYLIQNDSILLNNVEIADSFFSRFKGLMGVKNIDSEYGLYFPRCSSIHCFFMKVPIDVIYLDKDNIVLDKETVKPWKLGSFISGAKNILEVKEGRSSNIEIGKSIEMKLVLPEDLVEKSL